MARDRQRAKARRKRAEGPPPKKRDKRKGGGDEQFPETKTPAPDPLEDTSPYVDEAEFAEAGGEVPPPGESVSEPPAGGEPPRDEPPVDDWFDGDDDMERAPDEIEGDLVPAGHASHANLDPAVAEEHHASGATVRTERRQRGRVVTFLGHVVDELRRVQWPNRRQTGQGTAVTLGFVVLAGGYLGLMDAIWKPVIEAIL